MTAKAILPDVPVLRVRAHGGYGLDVDEISIDGHDLTEYVRAVSLRVEANEITVATLELEVWPDVELPGHLRLEVVEVVNDQTSAA